MTSLPFCPTATMIEGEVRPDCRACVILPAKNEEMTLGSTLDALARQTDGSRRRLPGGLFEVLLLLNNCTDGSFRVAREWQASHPELDLHITEKNLHGEEAHVGTARRLLMDTAWQRLRRSRHSIRGILSTDSDTEVARDWVWRNLAAFELGADAVGGVIHLKRGELMALPAGAMRAYRSDRMYQKLVAELEDRFDPQAGDPWPRHLEHFGASLSCTPEAYACAGGMPAVTPLEDVAFVDALRRCGARLRHDPAVKVYTSSRTEGRVDVGLSYQLRAWQTMSEEEAEHRVDSAEWLIHRFRSLRGLRLLFLNWQHERLELYPPDWRNRLEEARCAPSSAEFLGRVDCDRLIDAMFRGARYGEIGETNRELRDVLERVRSV